MQWYCTWHWFGSHVKCLGLRMRTHVRLGHARKDGLHLSPRVCIAPHHFVLPQSQAFAPKPTRIGGSSGNGVHVRTYSPTHAHTHTHTHTHTHAFSLGAALVSRQRIPQR